MSEAAREMTLEEVVNKLPEGHKARKEYESLLKQNAYAEALDAMGVDNWGGYGDAMVYLETGEVP